MNLKGLIKKLIWPSRQYLEDRIKEQQEEIDNLIQAVTKQNKSIEQYAQLVYTYKNEISGRIYDRIPSYMTGLNTVPREKKIVVSLTSYLRRISFAAPCIYTLLHQTYRPDMVILWLAEEDFPNRETDLPDELIALKQIGLSIRWCEELGPHKKYYNAMQEYPDDIVITVDDDVLYPAELIERLYQAYFSHPDCVIAVRARKVAFIENTSELMPYNDWPLFECGAGQGPDSGLVPTGVGGVLYPPHCMDERLFDRDKLSELCPYTDDLWLKIHEILKGTKVYKIGWPYQKILYVEGSQENALWHINQGRNQNDIAISKLKEYYKKPERE